MNKRAKRSNIWLTPKEKFVALVKECNTYTQILSALGFKTVIGNSFKTLKARIKEESIDDSHIQENKIKHRAYLSRSLQKPLDEVLVNHSTYQTHALKRRLIKCGLLKNVCSECGQGPEWNGKPLVLQLDHSNGNNKDNRIENLRILCPNCHTQTSTYAGKGLRKTPRAPYNWRNRDRENLRKVVRPSKKDLEILIKENSWVDLGKMFGVSDNAVRKWAKRYNIE